MSTVHQHLDLCYHSPNCLRRHAHSTVGAASLSPPPPPEFSSAGGVASAWGRGDVALPGLDSFRSVARAAAIQISPRSSDWLCSRWVMRVHFHEPGNFLVLMLLLTPAGCGTAPGPERRLMDDEHTMWGRMNASSRPSQLVWNLGLNTQNRASRRRRSFRKNSFRRVAEAGGCFSAGGAKAVRARATGRRGAGGRGRASSVGPCALP